MVRRKKEMCRGCVKEIRKASRNRSCLIRSGLRAKVDFLVGIAIGMQIGLKYFAKFSLAREKLC